MPALTPEQEALKQAALAAQGKTMLSKEGCTFYDAANPAAILDLLGQLEAQEGVSTLPSTPLPGEALHGEPSWRTADISWACSYLTESTSYDGALILREWEAMKVIALAAETAAMQPAQADTDKLLGIIYRAYQIAGAHDAPAHILDVLSDPEAATMEQVEAMLPYQPGLVQAVPDVLFDGMSVYEEITRMVGKGHCISPEAVAATLDAVVRMIRAAATAPGEPGQ